MNIITVGLVVWVFAPALILLVLVAWLGWRDRRAWRRDERSMLVWMAMEESWNLPPHDRPDGRLHIGE